jgi:endogenous inhibitor of DNA gyrase (YacG/DUF329 family)
MYPDSTSSAAVTLDCAQCGKTFSVWRSTMTYSDRRFCSMTCKGQAFRTIKDKSCPHCGVTFRPDDSSRKFCSRRCYGESKRQTRVARFWAFVHKTDTCWLWTGHRDRRGYGQLTTKSLLSHVRKTETASRIAWEIHNGSIPDGMFVCHHCDNPPCVRPDHLFLGTAADNVQDMLKKGRHRYVLNPRSGEQHACSKLTHAQVVEIRMKFAGGLLRHIDLAEMFGVSRQQIGSIVSHKAWRHVD